MKSIAEELNKINKMGYCTKGGNFACLCKKCVYEFKNMVDKLYNNDTVDK